MPYYILEIQLVQSPEEVAGQIQLIVPMLGHFFRFGDVRRLLCDDRFLWFFPVLAARLSIFNGTRAWIGEGFRHGPIGAAALTVVLSFIGLNVTDR